MEVCPKSKKKSKNKKNAEKSLPAEVYNKTPTEGLPAVNLSHKVPVGNMNGHPKELNGATVIAEAQHKNGAHAVQNGHHSTAATNGERVVSSSNAQKKRNKNNKQKMKNDVELQANGKQTLPTVLNGAETNKACMRENGFNTSDATKQSAEVFPEKTVQRLERNCTATINSNTDDDASAAAAVSNGSSKSKLTQHVECASTSAWAAANAAVLTASVAAVERNEPATAKNNSANVAAAPPAACETIAAPAVEQPVENPIIIEYKHYESELQMHNIMRLIQAELSEPYSIYTYRYFIYNWPELCFLAADGDKYVGAIVCKLDVHANVRRGYIAMLAVSKEYRKLKIGTTLVQKAIEAMLVGNAEEVVLETEMSNVPAQRLYENLGFVRDKRLFRYYLNGVDALRLKLWFR